MNLQGMHKAKYGREGFEGLQGEKFTNKKDVLARNIRGVRLVYMGAADIWVGLGW